MSVPFMRLFVADYQADTMHLSTMEHGAYLLLLMNYWQRGKPLPDDDKKLARIAGLGPREWQRIKPAISEFFEIGCSGWLHKRVETELAHMRAMSLKKRKGGLARAEQMHSERSAPAQQTDTEADTDSSVSKDTGAGAPLDPEAAFWANALGYLGKSKRSMVGRWVSKHGREATATAITQAQINRAVDPIPYIERTLNKAKQADWEFTGPC
jgi:uncharacterized protein YdaU (DUF1376 family)